MKKILYAIVFMVILSCSNENKKEVKEDIVVKTIISDDIEFQSPHFDTSYTYDGGILVFEYEEKGDFVGKWKEYYKNGILKETGQLSDDFGCGMNSGLFEFYDSLGMLTETKTYFNWLEDENDGCHSTRQDISVKEYYNNGIVKAEKFYETSYEGEEYKVGDWIDYSEKGVVIKTESYKSNYSISNFSK